MGCALGHAYAVSGKRREALKTLADLQDGERRYVAPVDVALVHAGLGDEGLQWLEKAYGDHSQRLLHHGEKPSRVRRHDLGHARYQTKVDPIVKTIFRVQ
jgi:hypothetical protein